ncbi:RNase adapter RapZ [Agrococcus sp. SL85]|uniref:RNase adapter RapZ n=1 Tax=Agrococcus sp. SL85 TaxID=2995141 RepID=UPI00226CCAA9|nr:RNase adapter RapZ [Agrococcus sp. SL85]WAC65886.1 RNase adapter RapZ [Agrococcus sp. SL85]
MHAREIVIITGMSGAGRSTVANALEDLGWFVVDNLPPTMLQALVRTAAAGAASQPRLAIVVDVRGGTLFDDAKQFIEMLRSEHSVRILFLEASDAELVRRYEQVRRPHPLQGDGTILDGIRLERTRLQSIRGLADETIDTSGLNPHQLTTRVGERFAPGGQLEVTLTIMSFGFKYGTPVDADLIADMRFLPNPFWIPELRGHDGTEPEVAQYVLSQEGATEFADRYVEALRPVLAGYLRENKLHAVLGVGCTGGKHRSVAMSQRIAASLEGTPGVRVSVKHRDLGRE